MKKKEKKMSVECNGQGQVDVIDLVNGINDNESRINTNESNISTNTSNISTNVDAIVNINNRLSNIEGIDISSLESRVTQNEQSIVIAEANITANSSSISNIEVNVNNIDARVFQNEGDIATLKSNVQTNTDSINTLGPIVSSNESRISSLESAIGSAQSALLVHEEPPGIDGGSSIAGAWTPRNIMSVKHNSLGVPTTPTSINLDEGEYRCHANAVAEGGVHQSRLNIGGGIFVYGTVMPSSGISHVVAHFTLTTSTSVSIETNVDTSVPDTGFGTSSPFGGNSVYVTLEVEKVG